MVYVVVYMVNVYVALVRDSELYSTCIWQVLVHGLFIGH